MKLFTDGLKRLLTTPRLNAAMATVLLTATLFTGCAVQAPTATPAPEVTATAAPTAMPTPTPAPTPVPDVEPEELTLDWQKAYFELYESIAALDGMSGVVTGLCLVDLSGDGVPELLVFNPGASVNGGVSILTMEDGEPKAFTGEYSYGLPTARNAIPGGLWANPATGVLSERDMDFAHFRYYTELASPNGGFYLLNSRNAAWPAEVWCDWLRFGADEGGYLTCESLLSWEVSGEESLREGYRETGWRLNGEEASQEEYQAATEEFDLWLDGLSFVNVDWGQCTVAPRGGYEEKEEVMRQEFLKLLARLGQR